MFTFPVGFIGGGLPVIPFATTLYGGSGSNQSIITGKDNAAGSLNWLKRRDSAVSHSLIDTERGSNLVLQSNQITAQTNTAFITAFNSNGIDISASSLVHTNAGNWVLWTFLKQAGFFDIVKYIGSGNPTNVNHNLGVSVGAMIVANTTSAQNWAFYHRMMNGGVNPASYSMALNTNAAQALNTRVWNDTPPTSAQFSVWDDVRVNALGNNYIAYIFAHNPDAGIFCGSFTTDGSGNATVNLGWRAQWVKAKCSTGGSTDWIITDKKRGAGAVLRPNLSNTEVSSPVYIFTNTGFTVSGETSSQTHIFIAIRDGI